MSSISTHKTTLMRSHSYVHEPPLTNKQLLKLLGKPDACAWCAESRTPDKTRRGIAPTDSWLPTPLRSQEPRWVCISCYLDVYSACNSQAFDEHPDRKLVVAIAEDEGMTAEDFRRRAWEHQLSILVRDRVDGRADPRDAILERRLRLLLEQSDHE